MRDRYRKLLIGFSLCWIFAGAASLLAQDQPGAAAAQPVIATDRPAITDSSTVVPAGSLLFENGFAETADQGQRGFDFSETLARFGLTSKTELRFSAPEYFQNYNTGGGFGSGWGDLALGLKQQLVAGAAGFDASLVVSLSLPTGAQALSSHGYDPQVLLPWSHALSKNWTVAGMFSLFWPTEGPRRNLTGQASFLFDRQITSRWDAFIEYGGDFPQRGSPAHLLHTGTSYKIASNQQLDFHVGFGLSSAAADHFIGFGYSLQFQPFHRAKRHGL
jgi:hypothetical protein